MKVILMLLLLLGQLAVARAGQLGRKHQSKVDPNFVPAMNAPVVSAAAMPGMSFYDNVDSEFRSSCGCTKSRNTNNLRSNLSPSFLEVNCEGVDCNCEKELNEFEAYSRSQSERHRPDGRCYFHVANFIDAMGYGGIAKNGFNNCVGSQYHQYAYQFHSAIGASKCGLKDVKEQYGNNPYNAPRGALVVVSAGTPGTAHPVAGDIAVAAGDGRFWNGGNMRYGGKDYDYSGKLLAIYVPESCNGGSMSGNAENNHENGESSTDNQNSGLNKKRTGSRRRERVDPEEGGTSSHGDCIACIKNGGGKACMPRCPSRPHCQNCIKHAGGKACAPRCE